MLIVLGALTLAACGGDGGSNEPSGPVLTTVEVAPTSSNIYITAPGNSVDLVVAAKDQDGDVMAGAGAPTFVSSNTAIATVSVTGRVTAVAAGTAQITATVQAGSATKAGTMSVSVLVPPATASVAAPQLAFQPGIVHVSVGGTVTWVLGNVHHTVNFTSPNAPADIPEIINVSVPRDFLIAGSYPYNCDIHAGMFGTVHVH